MQSGDLLSLTRLRRAIDAGEEERRRWARELHDETLQGLGAVRVVLAHGRRGDPVRLLAAVGEAIGLVDQEIDGLRSFIRELRPASLDELGPRPAIEDLASRTEARQGIAITTAVALDPRVRHPADVEVTLYRIIQEALGNAVKHAGAEHLHVAVSQDADILRARVVDDGHGFDLAAATTGFGLEAIRERVGLVDGTLDIVSSEAGTSVTAALPGATRA
jgi:two-component system, NarL family, sensor histidine kinase DevS